MSGIRRITLVMGIALVALGVWALVPSAGGLLLGLLPVSPLLGVLLLATGSLLLFGAASTETARGTARALGLLFALLGGLALISNGLFGTLPINGWSTVLFAVVAALLLLAGRTRHRG